MPKYVAIILGSLMQKIVIFGPGKTGTTALYHKLLSSLGETRVFTQFEPNQLKLPQDSSRYDYYLTKALLSTDRTLEYSAYNSFEKIIYILRDPRDWIISLILFRMRSPVIARNPDAVQKIIALLQRKEQSPNDVSVYTLIDEFAKLTDQNTTGLIAWVRNLHIWLLGFEEFCEQYYTFRYEDLVDANWQGLQEYLSIPLAEGNAQVTETHSHVIRTKTTGDWKNWFLESDVELFQPIFAHYIDRHGYSIDWTLKKDPIIKPEFGSEYVRQNMSIYK